MVKYTILGLGQLAGHLPQKTVSDSIGEQQSISAYNVLSRNLLVEIPYEYCAVNFTGLTCRVFVEA